MKRLETVVPNRLETKEIQQLIKDGFDVPTVIPKHNEKFFVLVGKFIYTDKQTKEQTKRLKVVCKDAFDLTEGKKRVSDMKNGVFILHNPTLVAVEPAKKEKGLSNTAKGKVKTLHNEGKSVQEIATELELDSTKVGEYIAKL